MSNTSPTTPSTSTSPTYLPCDELILLTCCGRTGHHAVAEWLCVQLGDALFIDKPHQEQIEGSLEAGRARCHVWNCENVTSENALCFASKTFVNGSIRNIVLLRDYRNWLASVFRWGGVPVSERHRSSEVFYAGFREETGSPVITRRTTPERDWDLFRKYLHQMTGLWEMHAEEVLDGCDNILFNQWVDPANHEEMCHRLSIPYIPHVVKRVTSSSAFDGKNFDGRGDEMRLLDRWQQITDPHFHTFLREQAYALDLSDRIFRKSPSKGRFTVAGGQQSIRPANYVLNQQRYGRERPDAISQAYIKRANALADHVVATARTYAIPLHTFLDVGCRTGYSMMRVIERSPSTSVEGIDIVDEFVKEAAKVGKTRIGDAHNLPYESNSFDWVFCCQTLEHCHDVRRALNELLRVARHCVCISVPTENEAEYAKDPAHYARLEGSLEWLSLVPHDQWNVIWARHEYKVFDFILQRR